ncbi:unnamed protein product [Clonostachys rosea]|uniref:Uncharacterized protein n=1 Tax=Bionectria ochroleuca TaxID=29856 RepID=A0ABY6UR08_BIOOC|nr:unnamed protein product [Clonostachys rosea]
MALVLEQRNSEYKKNRVRRKASHKLADVSVFTEEERPKLLRFARAGGPDLTDLRGYRIETEESSYYLDSDYDYEESTSGMAIPEKPRGRGSGASKPDFLRKCIRHKIYPRAYRTPKRPFAPKPRNIDSIREALRPTPDDPLPVGDAEFERFENDAVHATSEASVMMDVLAPLMTCREIKNMKNIPFLNLDSMTDGELYVPQPDFCDGAWPETVDDKVRDELERVIVPSSDAENLLATNFFLQVKGPKGTFDVAQKQVTLDGAYGSRMMHALQNFGKETPEYDENAYTFSATYIEGYLSLFAHHVAAPTIHTKGHPGYHITLLRGFVLHDQTSFADGVYALRSLRLLARKYRDEFIETANERADRMSRLQEEREATAEPAVEGDAGRDDTKQMHSQSVSDDKSEHEATASEEDSDEASE